MHVYCCPRELTQCSCLGPEHKCNASPAQPLRWPTLNWGMALGQTRTPIFLAGGAFVPDQHLAQVLVHLHPYQACRSAPGRPRKLNCLSAHEGNIEGNS